MSQRKIADKIKVSKGIVQRTLESFKKQDHISPNHDLGGQELPPKRKIDTFRQIPQYATETQQLVTSKQLLMQHERNQ